jgi:putative ABC transport system permease protein
MNFVAIKMLMGDKLKYISLVAGIAFASLLITQQGSIFSGYAEQIGVWIRSSSAADLWVMDSQVEFDNDFKPMRDTALQRVRGIEGVEWAVPMYKNYLQAQLPDGTRVLTRVVGLDDATLLGGPPAITMGNIELLRTDKAVFMNEDEAGTTMRLRKGNRPLRVGDRISVNDNDAVVAGTFKAPKEFFWDPVLYTTYSRALNWAPRERKQLMYIMVRVAAGVNPADVQRRIAEQTGLLAETNDAFERKTTWDLLGRTGILVNFGITIVLGFVIGLLVAGQTFYTFVLENIRHFGALKAMGADNATVVGMLVLQVLVVGLVGYGIGLGAAGLSGYLFGGGVLAFSMSWHIPVFGALGVLVCCAGAALLGAVQVLRLEPAIVFRS